jgi:LPXTG-motif cell wall-anchored protein
MQLLRHPRFAVLLLGAALPASASAATPGGPPATQGPAVQASAPQTASQIPANKRDQRQSGRERRGRTGARVARRGSRRAGVTHAPRAASAAGDPPVTITDFQFGPATITIRVGDTVTWTNSGPSPHTATASGGGFNTGTLSRGQSGSHTFQQAGTFAYFCKIHPFMHGTVVVTGSGQSSGTSGQSSQSSGSGSGGSGSSTPSSSGSTGTSAGSGNGSSQTLPATGLDVAWALLIGTGLLGAGFLVRSRSA